jgi:hypothetical protein
MSVGKVSVKKCNVTFICIIFTFSKQYQLNRILRFDPVRFLDYFQLSSKIPVVNIIKNCHLWLRFIVTLLLLLCKNNIGSDEGIVIKVIFYLAAIFFSGEVILMHILLIVIILFLYIFMLKLQLKRQ